MAARPFLRPAFDEAEVGFVQRDDVEALHAHQRNGAVEEIRRQLEIAIGLELVGMVGADVVQLEDGAETARVGRHHQVGTAVV